MELIDVTLREIVYCVPEFEYSSALRYLRQAVELISNQDIQYIEIGYINNDKEGHLNYNADYINEAEKIINNKFKLVSIMHPHRANRELWDAEIIKKLSLVRIVVGGEVPESVKDFITYFHQLGVKVSVNVTYVASKNVELITNLFEKAKKYGTDYFYCADSSGSCTPRMIEAICCEIMKNKGNVQVGFHLHDHFQMSVANALMLKDCGYDLTDVSITGEGKGGGNLKTEFIIPIYRCLYGGTITAKELCNLYDLIVFFNQLIDRNGEFYEKAFIDSLTGLYKATLKKLDIIEARADDDTHRYIRLITGEEEI